MSIRDRILKYIEYKGISKYRFCQDVGLSNGFLDKKGNVGSDKCEKICYQYPDISLEWLLTGHGEMLKSDIAAVAAVAPVPASTAPAQEASPTTGGDVIHIYSGMLKEKDAEIARLNREIGAKDAENARLNYENEKLRVENATLKKRSAASDVADFGEHGRSLVADFAQLGSQVEKRQHEDAFV